MSGTKLCEGEDVVFVSRKGKRRFRAVVVDPVVRGGSVKVKIANDPYPVLVKIAQVQRVRKENMPTSVRRKKPSSEAKQLRRDARDLGVKGFADMGLKELRAAVAAASAPKKSAPAAKKKRAVERPAKHRVVKKAVAKHAPATKKAAPKKAPATKAAVSAGARSAENGNPYRPGSNLYRMTEELLRGGKRTDMLRRLKRSMTIRPWSKAEEENPDRAINKRLLITAGLLQRDFGFTVVREGRGSGGTVQVFPPGARKAKAAPKKAQKASAKKPAAAKAVRKRAA